jgi:hypothetical protein
MRLEQIVRAAAAFYQRRGMRDHAAHVYGKILKGKRVHQGQDNIGWHMGVADDKLDAVYRRYNGRRERR